MSLTLLIVDFYCLSLQAYELVQGSLVSYMDCILTLTQL